MVTWVTRKQSWFKCGVFQVRCLLSTESSVCGQPVHSLSDVINVLVAIVTDKCFVAADVRQFWLSLATSLQAVLKFLESYFVRVPLAPSCAQTDLDDTTGEDSNDWTTYSLQSWQTDISQSVQDVPIGVDVSTRPVARGRDAQYISMDTGNRIKLVGRMISYVFHYKNLHLIIRIFLHLVRWLVSRKDSVAFRRNTSVLTITNERINLWSQRPQLSATFNFITSHTGVAYHVERQGTPLHHGFSLLISAEYASVQHYPWVYRTR